MRVRTLCLAVSAVFLIAACDRSTGPRTGSIALSINGLPNDLPAQVSITGPNGVKLTATTSKTFADLEPGSYQISASNAVSARSTYAPSSTTNVVEVVAGDTPAQATVTYTVITGVAAISITGLPAGLTPTVTLINSEAGITRIITGGGEVGNLPPGQYVITASSVEAVEVYAGLVSPSSIQLQASTTAVPVNVTYTTITGTMRLTSAGLPQGVSATWDITGPGGFFNTYSSTGEVVITKLEPGQYKVTARSVPFGGENYGPSDPPVFVNVVAGQSVSSSTVFIIRPPTLDLTIDAAYLTQSTQNLSGDVPLIASRDAYVRVFVQANEPNSVTPDVRVRLYRDGAVIFTQIVHAPRPAVPTQTSQGTVTDAWSLTVPGSLLQPGTSFLVDVDPNNTVKETDDSDNQYPSNGTPRVLDLRTVAPVNLRFVPVVTGEGNTGNVTSARLAELVSLTLRMHPLLAVNAELRAPYSTTLQLVKGDSNSAWSKILSEINVLRVSEGTAQQYVGVLRDNGAGSGIAGIGYRPGRAVLTLDENYASEIVAHELGHNWNRPHSPCGGPAGVDPSYPYPEGNIGVFGYDPQSGFIQSPEVPDVMSYCRLSINFNLNVPRRWVSDYTYTNVMNHRAVFADAPASNTSLQDCLIVWGRITGGKVVLEPSFITATVPSLPRGRGPLVLNGRDSDGSTLYSLSFDALPVADLPGSEGHFAFAIPVNSVPVNRISRFELTAPGRAPSVQEMRSLDASPSIKASPAQPGFTRIEWDAAKNPLIVVRDPATREILSLARSGDAVVRTSGKNFEVIASNGVRSARAEIRQ